MQGRQADDSVADIPVKRDKTVTAPATVSEVFFILLSFEREAMSDRLL
jgi:hypothetical protein